MAIEPRNITDKREIAKLYYSGSIAGPVAKLYNANIISQKHIHFSEQRLLEDGFFNMLFIKSIDKVTACDANTYFVRVNPELKRFKNAQKAKRDNWNYINAKRHYFDYICALDDLTSEVLFGSTDISAEEAIRWSNHFVRLIYTSVNNVASLGRLIALETLEAILKDPHTEKTLVNCCFDSGFYRIYSAALKRRKARLIFAIHRAGFVLKRCRTFAAIVRSWALK